MEAPHDELQTKWGAITGIAAAVGSTIAYLRAKHWRKKSEEEPESNSSGISLKSLDKRIKDHDARLDEIDLLLCEMRRDKERDHEEIMRALRRIVSGPTP